MPKKPKPKLLEQDPTGRVDVAACRVLDRLAERLADKLGSPALREALQPDIEELVSAVLPAKRAWPERYDKTVLEVLEKLRGSGARV